MDISEVAHVGNATKATFSTGPQVFQTVHWNMASKEKSRRTYQRLVYTTGVMMSVNTMTDCLAPCGQDTRKVCTLLPQFVRYQVTIPGIGIGMKNIGMNPVSVIGSVWEYLGYR